MLGPRADDVRAARAVEARGAEQREIVGLGCTGGPHHLRGGRANQRGDASRAASMRARARRPGSWFWRTRSLVGGAQAGEHRLDHPRVDGGRRRRCRGRWRHQRPGASAGVPRRPGAGGPARRSGCRAGCGPRSSGRRAVEQPSQSRHQVPGARTVTELDFVEDLLELCVEVLHFVRARERRCRAGRSRRSARRESQSIRRRRAAPPSRG